MAVTKFDIERFTEKSDFGLWKIKMRSILVQQGLGVAIKETPANEAAEVDAQAAAAEVELQEKALSAIFLCLGDKVLREVQKETTAIGVWNKLESLFMAKSNANRLHLRQRLHAFKMNDERPLIDQADEFCKITDELENVDFKLTSEDKAVMLLSTLRRSQRHFKDSLLYGGKGTIQLEDVLSALRSKD